MKRAIVVGSGAGGATVAKELQGRFAVTVLEAGREFKPFALDYKWMERIKASRLLFDEREIQLLFPAMRARRTREGMVLVNGIGLGGTTTLSTGNALRQDDDLRALGIDLDAEFAELEREIPITTEHARRWRGPTRDLFATCAEMGLAPAPTPKMGDYARCANCGRCVFGCPHGVKWDSRQFLGQAVANGAQVVTGCRVERVEVRGGRATGVWARSGGARRFYPAELVVLAAGGLGTPVILQHSGIACEPCLFVDPVLCVAAQWKGSRQAREMPMPFVVQREGYIISPYFDHLSFFFNRSWAFPSGDILSLMIKLADENEGSVTSSVVRKGTTEQDRRTLREAVALCREILGRFGIRHADTFLGTLNGGHPGGTLPLTAAEAQTLRSSRLPDHLYVADATLLPRARGNPTILTIMALAKRVAKVAAEE